MLNAKVAGGILLALGLSTATVLSLDNLTKKRNSAENAPEVTTPVEKEPMTSSAYNLNINQLPSNSGKGLSPNRKVNLNSSNTYIFRDSVNAISVGRAQKALLEMDSKLPKGEKIYLFLDTPGGSVIAGSNLIDTARGLSREVVTINLFAASMGFHIAQGLGERLTLPSGIYMQHQAYLSGVDGELNGNLLSRVGFYLKVLEDMETANAKRIGVSLEDYRKHIDNEYYVQGANAVRQNVADAQVDIRCDKSLNGTNNVELSSFFYRITLVYSNCPAITSPLHVIVTAKTPSTINPMVMNRRVPETEEEVRRWVELYLSRSFRYVEMVNSGTFPLERIR